MDPVLVPIWPDAANALGIGRTKMFELISSGEIGTVEIGRRRLVPVEELQRFASAHEAEVDAPDMNGAETESFADDHLDLPDDLEVRSKPLPDPSEQPILTVPEAGGYLGLGRSTSYEAAREGTIPTIKIGGRIIVPTAQLRRLLGLVDGAATQTGPIRDAVSSDLDLELARALEAIAKILRRGRP